MAVISSDGPLALARRRLVDAVAAFADPIPVRTGDGYRWEPAAYWQLRSGLTGQPLRRRTAQQRSRPPLRIEVLNLLVEIDRAVCAWAPDEKGGTVRRLHAVAGAAWRPQDCDLINDRSAQLQRWAAAAAELLAPEPRVSLPMPCPSCGARVAYHRDGSGERVRSRALRVTSDGCTCLACGASWNPDRFEFLARLLGCAALPSV